MTLTENDIYITLADVGTYVDRTPQAISSYIRRGLLKKKDARNVSLHEFNKFLARKFPNLPRLNSVDEFDQWQADGRPTINRKNPKP